MRIVLVSPDPIFRSGFRTILSGTSDLRLVGEAADARSGFAVIDKEKPDLLAMAVALPGMNGIAAIEEVRRRLPAAQVLLLASWLRERDLVEGLAAGAGGLVVTTDAPETVLGAIRTVAAGQRYLPPEAHALLSPPARQRALVQNDVLAALSRREREVLDLVVRGRRSRDIARELCVSIKTIETHRSHINRKLHCASSADLVRFFADNGLWPQATGDGARPARVIAVVVDGCAKPMLDELLEELQAEPGAPPLLVEHHEAVPDTENLCRRLFDEANGPSKILTFDDEGDGPALRAVATLSGSEAGQGFMAALDRATARHRLRLDRRMA